MRKQTIAFDMDDVLVDSTEFWRLETNRRAGLALTVDDWSKPGEYGSYYETVWKRHKVDHLFSIGHVDAYLEKDQTALQAMPEALAVLQKLSKRFNLVVVTARDQSQKTESTRWLDAAYPELFSEIIFANGSAGLAHRNKGQICKDIGAAWLVDDNHAHCLAAKAEGLEAVLFGEYGWQHDAPDSLIRCRTWKDVELYFDAERSRQ